MDYCKITASGSAKRMPNPFKLTVSNPTETQKKYIAKLDNWLEMVYSEPPAYDPTTEYISYRWIEENGKAVQTWEVNPIEAE